MEALKYQERPKRYGPKEKRPVEVKSALVDVYAHRLTELNCEDEQGWTDMCGTICSWSPFRHGRDGQGGGYMMVDCRTVRQGDWLIWWGKKIIAAMDDEDFCVKYWVTPDGIPKSIRIDTAKAANELSKLIFRKPPRAECIVTIEIHMRRLLREQRILCTGEWEEETKDGGDD